MESLFFIGLIFITGVIAEWLSFKLDISKVVAYMFMGLLLAPSTSGLISTDFLEKSAVLIDLSLALIALLIGATLKSSELQGMARHIIVITAMQSASAFVIVSSGFFFLAAWVLPETESPLAVSILLGGIATATAPAATLAIISELKISNAFSRLLLAVVALDDAVALLLFAFALTVATAWTTAVANVGFSMLGHALYILGGSVVLGLLGGVAAMLFEKMVKHQREAQTIATLGVLFMAYAAAVYFALEPILVALVLGAVLTNLSKDFALVEKEIDNHIAEIVFMIFFMISAMHINLTALSTLPAAIATYILLRFFAKVGGSYAGSVLAHAPKEVRRYLGLGLLPQAGVALGLALSLQDFALFAPFAPMILNIIIATTLIHEFIAPFFTRYALLRTKRTRKHKHHLKSR